eukprot:GHVT01020542.1.p1 GENE.GHVT01020542.1~~GHVT01020542.1.p1  ORF type:complete len:190 (+),score=9.69 GHVT01020542.1:762-1331(+)
MSNHSRGQSPEVGSRRCLVLLVLSLLSREAFANGTGSLCRVSPLSAFCHSSAVGQCFKQHQITSALFSPIGSRLRPSVSPAKRASASMNFSPYCVARQPAILERKPSSFLSLAYRGVNGFAFAGADLSCRALVAGRQGAVGRLFPSRLYAIRRSSSGRRLNPFTVPLADRVLSSIPYMLPLLEAAPYGR